MNSTAALYARLGALSGDLATYGGAAAIFDDAAPDDFLKTNTVKPFLVIAAPASDRPLETLTENGRLIVQDIRGYQRHSGSSAALDSLMRAVRDLLHNRPGELTVTGGKCDVCRVDGPMASPTSDPALIGRRVTVRMDLTRS